jgi:biopolymer transport protein ExbD
MRFKRLKKILPLRSDVTYVPMVDIVFLLLLFFVISSQYVNIGIPVTLPTAGYAEASPPGMAELTINASNEFFLNGQKYTPEDLLGKLRDEAKRGHFIVIFGDEKCQYKNVVMAYDYCKGAGFEAVTLATRSSASPSTVTRVKPKT